MALQVNTTKTFKYHNDELYFNPDVAEKLKLPQIKEENVVFQNAYIVVSEVKGDKNSIEFKVSTYTDAKKTNFIQIKEYAFTPSVSDDSANFIKQAYEYLKTLTEYVGAIDC